MIRGSNSASATPTSLRLVMAIALFSIVGALLPAAAAASGPKLKVTSTAPDYVTPGKFIVVFVNVQDVGDEPFTGDLVLKYTWPAGVIPLEPPFDISSAPPNCTTVGQVAECTIDTSTMPLGRVYRYEALNLISPVATGILTGQIEVSGGGAVDHTTIPLSFDTAPPPPFDFKSFDTSLADGSFQPADQAGSHPGAVESHFQFPAQARTPLDLPGFTLNAPTETVHDIVAHAPPGFVGYPTASAVRCTEAELASPKGLTALDECPPDSQIGMVQINGNDYASLFNVVPPPGVPAEFGFFYQGVVIKLDAVLRPDDNGIDLVSRKSVSSVPLSQIDVEIWGVPADPSHDLLRADCLNGPLGSIGTPCPSDAAELPFLRQPTSCSGQPLEWGIEADTWQNPGLFHHRETQTPALTGCDLVPFEPEVSLTPTDSSAHSTSGLDVDLTVPQDSGPDGLSQADVRSASVSLPAGVGLNPAAAAGLAACDDAQLRLGLAGPSECPDASKLGTVEVETPLLEDPIGGSVYLRTQNSKDPESGQMYRLAIVLHSAERGVDVKLPGSLVVDRSTGRLTTRFDELPQLPFETMHLRLKAGPRAPLTTPQACGTYGAQATLEGWNGKMVGLTPTFQIDQNCTAPAFVPGFEAGAQNSTAGEFSPFTLRVTREAGMPNVSSITATLPEGELAKLAGVPLCPEPAAGSGACPAGSKIGSTVAAVGEGSEPLYIPQPGKAPTALYLAGPYKGAPFSVVASVPAQSGPFDLGTVVVRSALRVDPVTTRATVASDPLPQIFGGIPVSYRDVRVNVDRPKFTLTPTSCAPQAVEGEIKAAGGAAAAVSDRFQASDCAALGFKPKLALRLKGTSHRGGHPALTAVLKMPKEGANIASTSVALPHSEFLAQGHIDTSCTRVQYAAGGGGGAGCPKGSVYGHARAYTPLLDKPLEGPVYLRSNGGERELPDLVASLGGAIHVDLVGFVDSDPRTGGLRTTFRNVPDAPVSRFVLKLPGGKKSLLENSTNICHGKHRAVVKMGGQNGRAADFKLLVRAACRKGARKG